MKTGEQAAPANRRKRPVSSSSHCAAVAALFRSARIKDPVNKSEFIIARESHIRDSRSHAIRLFVILVAGGFVIAGFNLWLDLRYSNVAPIITLGLIVTLVVASCLVANAAIRKSASIHGLDCPQCGKTLGQSHVAAVAIETGKCGFCGYALLQETQLAEQAVHGNTH